MTRGYAENLVFYAVGAGDSPNRGITRPYDYRFYFFSTAAVIYENYPHSF